jgi:hypothetical protein
MARSSADQNQKPHWTPFRVFPRLFRKFPRLFREFPLLFLARLCSKNGIHPSTRLQSHATGCSRPLTTQPIPGECKPQCPITRFCGGMYHGVVTLAKILAQMILSHQVLFVPLLHDGPSGQTSKRCLTYTKYLMISKKQMFLKMYRKMYLFETTWFSKQLQNMCILMDRHT